MEYSKLFKPIAVGPYVLGQRLAMAPLTRYRADDDHVPLPFVPEYYAQRATSLPKSFLITEATFVSPQASGLANVPGLWTPEQLVSWKKVTDAVHAEGGIIFVQLWALGRAAFAKELAKKGLKTISASALKLDDTRDTPEPLTEEGIWKIIGEYTSAAKSAVEIAGFDGVEIHGANGYLVDQFIQSNTNQRTDSWGGSIPNRSRFAVEVAKAVSRAVGSERTGIRLSPYSTFQGMRMPDNDLIVSQFTDTITKLKQLDLAYLHLTTPRVRGGFDMERPMDDMDWAVKAWGPEKPLLLAGGFKPESARLEVDEKFPDYNIIIAFGRHYIANPDLPYRIKNGIPLTKYDRSTFYEAKSQRGYTNWPFSEQFLKERQGTGQPML